MIIFLLCAGSVKVWDPRQKGKPVATMEPAEGDARRDCWTVAFGKQKNVKCSLELIRIMIVIGRSQWLCGIRRGSADACLLGLQVRMDVCLL